jgi:nucleoid-associated protein YgaU
MSNPNNPNDPSSLSLAPGGGGKKADFSNVQGGSSSTEAEAPKADFSNVQGGSSSTEASAPGAEQTYTVQKGDNLSHIARQFYGKASAWNRIFEANRDQLDNPDLIKPGQVLKIPAAE